MWRADLEHLERKVAALMHETREALDKVRTCAEALENTRAVLWEMHNNAKTKLPGSSCGASPEDTGTRRRFKGS